MEKKRIRKEEERDGGCKRKKEKAPKLSELEVRVQPQRVLFNTVGEKIVETKSKHPLQD